MREENKFSCAERLPAQNLEQLADAVERVRFKYKAVKKKCVS